MNVLICSQYSEYQVREVCRKLEQRGINYVLFERYRKDQFITYRYRGKHAEAILNDKGFEYPLNSETFPVVWYRPKPILLSELAGELGRIEEKFCSNEWRAVLHSLDIFLNKSKWINPLSSNLRASNKAHQLRVAGELGLKIPNTVITNDSEKVLPLFNDGRVVFKTLNSFLTANQAIYTNEILKQDLVDRHNQIAMAPGIFQQYIEKKHELRVTVIGTKMFITQINSQLLSDSALDWRRKPDSSLYELGAISADTKNKLLAFHQYFGLVYAAYDFIVDIEDNEVFIECNPSGQWLWLENSLGLEVSDMILDEIIELSE